MKQKPIQNENREDSYALTVSAIAGIVDEWALNCDEPVYNAVLRMKAELFELRVQVIRLQLNDNPNNQ
jgi:hypothetical protein